MPFEVRTFETLQIVSLVIGLIHAFSISDESLWNIIVMTAPTLALTLLVSRKRKNWARLLLAILFAAGLIYMVAMHEVVLAQGHFLITLAVSVLQGVAIALTFTRQASIWIGKPFQA